MLLDPFTVLEFNEIFLRFGSLCHGLACCRLSAVGYWNIIARGAQGLLSSTPLSLPGRDVLNLVMLGGILTDGAVMATTGEPSFMLPALGAGSGVAALLGAHATASIGA